MLDFLEIIKRLQNGPKSTASDWDNKIISQKSNAVLKDHGLKGTFDPTNVLNQDDKLADRFFNAAVEYAIDTGVFCLDTERVIKFTEEEIRDAFNENVENVPLGQSPDDYLLIQRKPEDPQPPMGFLGPFGLPISEELWVPIHQSIIQEPGVDGLIPGGLEMAHGIEIRSGNPIETIGGYYEATITKKAAALAGRPHIPMCGVSTSPTQHGHLGGYGLPGGYQPSDLALVLTLSELKTTFDQLHKVAYNRNISAPIYSGHLAMIGGFPGGPENAALVSIAAAILQILVHQTSVVGGENFDVRYSCSTTPECLWADSISAQAESRNINRPIAAEMSSTAGPNTKMILYELTAAGLTVALSGASLIWGVRSAGGSVKEHVSPLENRFAGEIFRASTKLKRSAMNEIVLKMLEKYRPRLSDPPRGVHFKECTDPKTFNISKEWLTKYQEVKQELNELGLNLEE